MDLLINPDGITLRFNTTSKILCTYQPAIIYASTVAMMIDRVCMGSNCVCVLMPLNASERKHSSWIVSFLAVFMARLHVYAVSFLISCLNASGGTYLRVQSYLITRGTPPSSSTIATRQYKLSSYTLVYIMQIRACSSIYILA